jgi:hypothetical protein
MKKTLLSLMIVSAAITASAQSPVKLGIKAGTTFSKFSIEGDEGGTIKSNLSFYIGGIVDFPVSDMFSVQPGITLSGKGFKVDESGSGGGLSGRINVKTNLMYIEVPVNAVFSFPIGNGNIFLGAGPYYGMAITGNVKTKGSMTSDHETTSVSTSDNIEFGKNGDFKRGDFGANFLGGYQLSNGFNIHAGYGLGLSNIAHDSEEKVKNRVISVGLGFSF